MRFRNLSGNIAESHHSNIQLKFKYFFLGASVGMVVFAAFIFAADALIHKSNKDVTIEDFSPHDDGFYDEPGDYPTWMDEIVDPPAGVEAKDVYTFSCELVLRKPEVFTTACADFGEAVYKIRWSMWSAGGAKGSGIYSVNDCEPDCADGKIHEFPVYVWLLNTSTDGRSYYLNTLRIVPKEVYEGKVDEVVSAYASLSSAVVVEGKTLKGAEWDVSDYWKNFPNMRAKLPK